MALWFQEPPPTTLRVCQVNEKVDQIIEQFVDTTADYTTNATLAIHTAERGAAVLASSATLMLALGAALVFAPVLLGKSWTAYIIWVLTALIGAVLSHRYLEPMVAEAIPYDEGSDADEIRRCAISLAVVGACALFAGSLAMCIKRWGFFTIGAAAGAVGSYELILASAPGLAGEGVEVTQGQMMLIVATCAVILGTYIACTGDRILDAIAGLLGCVMVANGGLTLLKGTGAASRMHVAQYRAWYVAGTMMVLMTAREYLTARRSKFTPPKAIVMQ